MCSSAASGALTTCPISSAQRQRRVGHAMPERWRRGRRWRVEEADRGRASGYHLECATQSAHWPPPPPRHCQRVVPAVGKRARRRGWLLGQASPECVAEPACGSSAMVLHVAG